MFGNDVVRGGSPWGAGTLAGPDGSRQPSAYELEQAEYQVGFKPWWRVRVCVCVGGGGSSGGIPPSMGGC